LAQARALGSGNSLVSDANGNMMIRRDVSELGQLKIG